MPIAPRRISDSCVGSERAFPDGASRSADGPGSLATDHALRRLRAQAMISYYRCAPAGPWGAAAIITPAEVQRCKVIACAGR